MTLTTPYAYDQLFRNLVMKKLICGLKFTKCGETNMDIFASVFESIEMTSAAENGNLCIDPLLN